MLSLVIMIVAVADEAVLAVVVGVALRKTDNIGRS